MEKFLAVNLQNNFKYVTVLYAFSKNLRYILLYQIAPKTIYHGSSRNTIPISEKLFKNRLNVIIISILPVLLSVLYQPQNLFSTFGVVGNDFFGEDI